MKIKLIVVLLALLLPLSAYALFGGGGKASLTPFGGAIILITPCDQGSLILLGPPRGGSFMYIPGASFSFLVGSPTHPAQWLWGLATVETNCTIDGYTVGQGKLIFFHGSSR